MPFIVAGPQVSGQGRVDTDLVSIGLDLLPTICAAAGITPPAGLRGRDILAGGEGRSHVFIETGFGSGPAPTTAGRAVVGHRYKYAVYSWGKNREQLFDLTQDPGEQVNLAVEAKHQELLEEHRSLMLQHCLDLGDETILKRLVLPRGTGQEIRNDIYAVPY